MQNVAKCLKLKFISHTTYYKIINEYVAPVIHDTWNNERDEYIGTLQENKNYDLRLCGDGQFDSPGHCAKYLCYTLMEVNTNKIVDFVLPQNNVTLLGGRLEGRSSHEPCLPCGATGQRRDRSLQRPTWLPDVRSWENSISMSELGIVCRRLTYLAGCCTR
jgi:hypothetical protein